MILFLGLVHSSPRNTPRQPERARPLQSNGGALADLLRTHHRTYFMDPIFTWVKRDDVRSWLMTAALGAAGH